MTAFALRGARWRRRAAPYLLLSPAFALMALLVLLPVASAANMSFYNYVLTRPWAYRFVGLDNYARALADPIFVQAIGVTGVWIAGVVGLQLAIGLLFALVLNENMRFRGALRSLVLVPWATPSVICAFIFMWLLDGNHGIVNAILLGLGVIAQPIQWLSTPGVSLWAAIIALVWHGAPFFAVMLLAGLQTISDEYYEAAEIDGAGAWQRFRYVTFPLLLPTMLVTVLLRVIWTANHVEIPLVMTQGGPANSATTLAILTIVTARGRLDYGYAASLSMWLAALLAVVAVAYLRHRARRLPT